MREIAGWTVIATLCCLVRATEFIQPAEWNIVRTNAVRQWQASKQQMKSDDLLVLNGVMADKRSGEVRLLAEAVGHSSDTIVEFLLIGPRSDRAYESVAVTIAAPDAIVRAVEFTGVKRGDCVDGRNFRFVPRGERFRFAFRLLDSNEAEQSLSTLLRESESDDSLLNEDGFVFAGGEWKMRDGVLSCVTATVSPCAVVSLYNEKSIFDLPFQAGQSEVYGRFKMRRKLPQGTLLEIILRPVEGTTVLSLDATALASESGIRLKLTDSEGEINQTSALKDALEWLRSKREGGAELYLRLKFDLALTLRQAREIAAVFDLLDGQGLHLYGKVDQSIYYKAFLPRNEWRKRESRVPQPFELRITRNEENKIKRKFIFIEEDWSVEGLDPALTPHEFDCSSWDELPGLLEKSAGPENKVRVLFVFAPHDMPLREFMPGINALSAQLPLVHVFNE
jgi:hypothetical protein